MSAQPDVALNSTLSAQIRSIVGQECVRSATPTDAVLGVQPKLVVEPVSCEQLARVLHLANEAGLVVIPCGGRTKLEWGNPPRAADLVISSARLDRVLEHAWADLTVTVEAGCTIDTLQRTLALHGQRLAIDVLWSERATVGGILATNDSGSLRSRFGGLRDLIIGTTIVLPDGTIARSGGKVVKNVAGYDLMKLTTGALGTLGVTVSAVFRLHPLPLAQQTISFETPDLDHASQFLLDVCNSNLAYTGLQVRCGGASAITIDVRFEGIEAGVAAQIEAATRLGSRLRASTCKSPWNARQNLWRDPNKIIAKIGFLLTDFPLVHDALSDTAAGYNVDWEMVAYGHGLAWVAIECPDDALATILIPHLRSRIEQRDGSVVVLCCPLAIRAKVDAWGNLGDAGPLMRRVKQQFDPNGTLNSGRFVGGI